MAQYNFGTGTLIGKRTDTTYSAPVQFGTLQNVNVDFARTVKELIGQYQVPVALGAGELKITGKAAFARISFAAFNNLFFGATPTTGLLNLTPLPGVAATVPGTPYVVTPTVPGSGTFVEDQGVFYSTTGVQLVPVASSPTIGQYSVNNSTGAYTFAAADTAAAMLFFFTYTTSTGNKVTLTNQLMGIAPTFQLNLQQNFAQFGTTKYLNLQLNCCMSSKLGMAMKNSDFTIPEFDFMIQADAAGNYGTLSVTDP